jgi:membrane protein EpsK
MSPAAPAVEIRPAKKGRLSINLASNVGNLILSTAIGIFYVPFLVRTLGPAVYGLVPLATIITSYMGIVTLGLNSAVGRHITVALEGGDKQKANLIFNTSLWGSVIVTAVLLVISVAGVIFLDQLIAIPAEFERQTRILFGCVAGAFLLNQLKTPFEVSTFCKNRFDLRNLVDFTELLVRVGLVVVLFLVLVPNLSYVGAAIGLGTVISFIGVTVIWKQLTPELRVDPRSFDWQSLKELTETGAWVVVNHLGALLYLGIDLLVANRMFGAELSGRYAAILQLAIFIRTIGSSIGPVFSPTVLFYYAKNDIPGLISFLRWAMKLMGLLLALPIGLTCGFAEPLLKLWLGPTFGALAPLLFLMAIHLCVNLAVNPLLGLQLTANRVKTPGLVTLVMGLANFLLAVVLARHWGLYGIAAAGAIMLTAKNLLFTPVYAARIVRRPAVTFLAPLIPTVFATVAIIALCHGVAGFVEISDWLTLTGLSLGIAAVHLIASYALLLNNKERAAVRDLIARIRAPK